MRLNNLVKRLQDIMRNDAGINGDAQRIEQMVWILFLKVYDAKEEVWEFYNEKYTSIIPEELRWRNWAVDHKDGKALTGDTLLNFVNSSLFPKLKSIEADENTPMSQIIVRAAFEDNMAIFRSRCNPYIQMFINSYLFREQLEGATTTTINQITQRMLKKQLCPLPPLNEQNRIVAKIEELFSICDQL